MRALWMSLIFILSISVSESTNYEKYTFESYWLGTTCKFNPCLPNETLYVVEDFFNIHGLWPDGALLGPNYCDNTSIFQPEAIDAPLNTLLKMYWIGMNESSDQFHAHEWSKHGTCWNDPVPTGNQTIQMNDYFSAAVAVAFRVDMYSTLANADILPSITPYKYAQLFDALNTQWGPGTFGINCQNDTAGNQYLNNINVCLDLEYNIDVCPSYVAATCVEGDIFYPPMNFEATSDHHQWLERYWPIQGLAQPIRYILEYCGIEYKDFQYNSKEAWLTDKDTLGFDFPNLPYLVDGDIKLTESFALIQYVCLKYNTDLLGKSSAEKVQVAMLYGVVNDLRNDLHTICFTTKEGFKDCLDQTFQKKSGQRLESLTKFLGQKEFLNGNICYVDFMLLYCLDIIQALNKAALEKNEVLVKYHQRLRNITTIKALRESKRFIKNFLGSWAIWGGPGNCGGYPLP